MPERFLGIDTSNYRTSAAIYNAETGEWVNRGGLRDRSAPVGCAVPAYRASA